MKPGMPLRIEAFSRREATIVPREALTFVRLTMPAVGRSRLADATRLQLTQYMPPGSFGFVCRTQRNDEVLAWAWRIDASNSSPGRPGKQWPEPALDPPGDGIRLVRRVAGFEAQHWQDSELRQSRWYPDVPAEGEWSRFVRGCGVDPSSQPLPQPTALQRLNRPAAGWLAGDNLPAADRWQGWHWQAGVLAAGCFAAAALGVQLRAVDELSAQKHRLAALRSGHEASLKARERYQQVSAELEALSALTPKLSQLALLDRVVGSGLFAPLQLPGSGASAADAPAAAAPGPPGLPAAPAAPKVARVRLLDWEYHNGQVRMTLELPGKEVSMLDVARRVESVLGIGSLRIGQESSGNTITLIGSVTRLEESREASR